MKLMTITNLHNKREIKPFILNYVILQENYRMGGSFEWPSVSGILGYRQQVRKVILDVIDSAVFDLPVKMDDPLVILF